MSPWRGKGCGLMGREGVVSWEGRGVVSWEGRGVVSWEGRGVVSWEGRGVVSWGLEWCMVEDMGVVWSQATICVASWEGCGLKYCDSEPSLLPLSPISGAGLIPRAATFDGSPFIRHRKNRGGSLILPGMGPVKLRHGSTHIPYGHSGPNMDPGNIPDDLMSLEDFLAESEKTPNRVCICVGHLSEYPLCGFSLHPRT